MSSKLIKIIVAYFVAMTLISCSSIDVPRRMAQDAQDRVDQAHTVGAEQHAPVAYKDAQKFLKKAESEVESGDNKSAVYLLEKSIVNAELAIAQTHAQKSQKAAEQIESNLEALQREANVTQ